MKRKPSTPYNKTGSSKPFKRDDRQQGEKSERPFRKNNDDRPARPARDERSDKPRFERKDAARSDRRERGGFEKGAGRGERPFKRNNEDRPARFDRDAKGDKPRFERKGDDRREGGYKSERPFKRNNEDRPARFNRDESGDKPRFERKDHGGFGKSGDGKKKFGNADRFDKKDRGDKRPFDKDKKRSFEDRDQADKPARFENSDREERPERKKFSSDKVGRPNTKKRRDEEEEKVEKPEKNAYKTPHKHKRAVEDKPQPKPQTGKRKRKFADEDDEEEEMEASGPMPLNKYIAHSGECSRRDAADLVKQGKVKVNGELVTDPGYRVQEFDKVTLLGKKLAPQKNRAYILLNKPKGFITTTEDPQERKTVMELVDNSGIDRLYPVGRLDRNTTGLLLLTNDGDLAQKLSHPSYEVKKVYQVTLDKPLTKNDFQKIADGLTLEDGPVNVDEIAYLETKNEIGIQIHSGRNRIVRRIFESLGYEVEKLDRVVYAGLTKKNLPRSKWRFLTDEEIILLKHFKS